MSQVTVLGMGAMGSRMALSLLKAGQEVTVWNRHLDKTNSVAQAGAKVAETPRVAVRNAEFVISMVRDDEASKQVWLDSKTGALPGLSNNAVAIESSTLTVSWIEKLGQQFKERKLTFLDAPVAGTLPQAEAAQLIYFVGGEVEPFKRIQPILQTMGSRIHHVGALGSGMTIKLAVNALFGIQISALGELIGLMTGCGLEKKKAVEILTTTPVCSPAVKGAAAGILSRNFAPLFPIELVEKDLSYAVKTAKENQNNLPITTTTQQTFRNAIAQGYSADNITGIAQLYI
ncbi:MAG: NAD(P)-dependent oxidoreductase [Pleurocapsa sp.]